MDQGTDLYVVIDYETASHWCVYNHDLYTVETWCTSNPNKLKTMTRFGPMTKFELFMESISEFSLEQQQHLCFEYEKILSPSKFLVQSPVKISFWKKVLNYITKKTY